jgi:hypothetical protein
MYLFQYFSSLYIQLLIISRDDQQISSFFNKIFIKKKNVTDLVKQIENEGICTLYMGFPLFFTSKHIPQNRAFSKG